MMGRSLPVSLMALVLSTTAVAAASAGSIHFLDATNTFLSERYSWDLDSDISVAAHADLQPECSAHAGGLLDDAFLQLLIDPASAGRSDRARCDEFGSWRASASGITWPAAGTINGTPVADGGIVLEERSDGDAAYDGTQGQAVGTVSLEPAGGGTQASGVGGHSADGQVMISGPFVDHDFLSALFADSDQRRVVASFSEPSGLGDAPMIPAPEPGSLLLMGSGLLWLWRTRSRRSHRVEHP